MQQYGLLVGTVIDEVGTEEQMVSAGQHWSHTASEWQPSMASIVPVEQETVVVVMEREVVKYNPQADDASQALVAITAAVELLRFQAMGVGELLRVSTRWIVSSYDALLTFENRKCAEKEAKKKKAE